MPQIFHRSTNTLSKVSLAGILLLVGGLIGLAMLLGRSSYVTRAQEYVEQPVQFSHLHHVLDDGIDCRYCHTSVETCHGRVDQMPLMKQENSLQMEWCVNCHRNPQNYVRPREEVFTMGYRPSEDQATLGARLVDAYKIKPSTDCSTCHR